MSIVDLFKKYGAYVKTNAAIFFSVPEITRNRAIAMATDLLTGFDHDEVSGKLPQGFAPL